MKHYQTFEDIDYDIKRLNLERQIAYEELKGLKSDIKDDLKPANWVLTIMNYAKKYGFYLLLKKVIR